MLGAKGDQETLLNTVVEKPVPPKRIDAIDQFRGFAILLMVLANYFNDINTLPVWLKHAQDIGYTFSDLVAPMFVFTIGLTYGLSFRRRYERDGAWGAYNHVISRNLALIGLGFLITLGGTFISFYPPSTYWGLLQALGAAGLITLPFIKIKSSYRWIVGVIILAVYQLVLNQYWLDQVINAAHNGPQGALSWGAMLIIATSLGDLYQSEEKRSQLLWLSLLFIIVGGLTSPIIPISKHRASASYVFLSLGLSCLIFYALHLLGAKYHYRIPLLTEWGKNSLLLYILHGVLLGLIMIPNYPGWYFYAPLWLVFVQASMLILVLSWIGVYCNRRGWFLTI
jgi:predicted acyltransferase